MGVKTLGSEFVTDFRVFLILITGMRKQMSFYLLDFYFTNRFFVFALYSRGSALYLVATATKTELLGLPLKIEERDARQTSIAFFISL